MHTTVDQAVSWLETVQEALRGRAAGQPRPTPIVCPPFVSLAPLRERMDAGLLRLGAQNCHWEAEGPYTGEVSVNMLAGLVDYVMAGHSERRAAGETDTQVARKVRAIAGAGLTPILFVGEQEPGDASSREAEHQLAQGLSGVDVASQEVLVVYEPVWAVGADHAAGADHVRTQVEALKHALRGRGAPRPQVIYGGTVNDDNIEQFAALEVLDGVGATRASLEPASFLAVLDRLGPEG